MVARQDEVQRLDKCFNEFQVPKENNFNQNNRDNNKNQYINNSDIENYIGARDKSKVISTAGLIDS